MNFVFSQVLGKRSTSRSAERELFARYVERASKYTPCLLREFASEAALLEDVARHKARTAPFVVLADSAGRSISSSEFAAQLESARDRGVQQIVFAVGPANGWSDAMRARADLSISFGRITLPHELAAVVLAEQVYRALTILAGHPYHSGH